METSIEGEFSLGEFSPQILTFIPSLNCVLASNWGGQTRCIDVVTGHVQQSLGKEATIVANRQLVLAMLSVILLYILCLHPILVYFVVGRGEDVRLAWSECCWQSRPI